jgi:hypothetical protein
MNMLNRNTTFPPMAGWEGDHHESEPEDLPEAK